MFPTHSLSVGLIVVLILSLFVAFGLTLSPSHGYWVGHQCGNGDCYGYQQTWFAWSETWHAYNGLDMPLRPYYIPRTPGRCDRNSAANYALGCECGDIATDGAACGSGGGYNYPPQAGVGFEPVQFERIGKIPNDSDLGGLPAPAPHGQ